MTQAEIGRREGGNSTVTHTYLISDWFTFNVNQVITAVEKTVGSGAKGTD